MQGAHQIEKIGIEKLIPYAKNSRTHSDEQVAQIAASIKEFGFNNPVLIGEDDVIIAGHGRVMAARKIGLMEVPCIRLGHLNETQRKAYIIADNRLALNAGWDNELLTIELNELLADNFALDILGFDVDELKNLLDPVKPTEGLTDEDEVPEVPEEPKTKPGDIYQLGRHRLMCGDSTSIDAVEKLMDGQKADMVFTDPPYNIGFGGTMSNTTIEGRLVPHIGANAKHDEIHNDKKSKSEFNDFITSILSVIKIYCVGGYYICFSSSTLDELLSPLVNTGIGWKSIIIWNKNQSPMGGGHFRRKYEPIVYGYFENHFYGQEYAEDDVWDVARTRKNDLHPTMKPIELVEKAIGYSSRNGGSVLDLFGGSGSTMIACEKLGRTNFTMELDPKYCDVIVKRWEDFTGQKAELV
jgi:DNA modification methylase